MRRTIVIRGLVCAAVLLCASGVAGRRAAPGADAQVMPGAGGQTQVKTRDIIRSSVSSVSKDSIAAALQQSLQQADVQETDSVLKGAIEQTLANPQTVSDAANQIMFSFGGGAQSATVPIYGVDAQNGTIAVLNLQVTRTSADTGNAQPTQHDDLRSFINNQLAKDVGDAVLTASKSQTTTLSAAADQSRKTLSNASSTANNTYDVTTNRGQFGDQQAAAQQAVTQTDQQVLQSLYPPVGPQTSSTSTNVPGLCIVTPLGGGTSLQPC